MTQCLDMLGGQVHPFPAKHHDASSRVNPICSNEAPIFLWVNSEVQVHGRWVGDVVVWVVKPEIARRSAAYDSEREPDELGDAGNRCTLCHVVCSDPDSFEFSSAKGMVAGTVDAHGGDYR